MRAFKTIVAASFVAVALFFTFQGSVKADVNNFTVTNFTGDYYLNQKDPQGALDIHEVINVALTDQNHGILRALPEHYNGQPLRIHVEKVRRNGQSEQYTTYTSNGNLVLKIGDPTRTITGSQNYEIDYSAVNVMRFLNDHDELDWNINGDQWSQPFEKVSATLHVPTGLVPQLTNAVCYTGAYGSTAQDCTVTRLSDEAITYGANNALPPNSTLTMRADFKLRTFAAPTFKDWLADHWQQIIGILGIPIIALIVAGGWWAKSGRDVKGRGTIIPEYGPPDNLKAAHVDVIAHNKLSTKAISATIVDLAIRKYLKIIEVDKSRALGIGTSKTYRLELLHANVSGLSDYEQEIVSGLFGSGAAAGATVDLKDLKNNFYTTSQAVQKLIPVELTALGYFAKNPLKAGAPLHIIGALLAFGGFFIHSIASVGMILAGLIFIGFGILMPKRTAKGAAAEDVTKGLKMYMEVAEKDRIAMLQSPDAPYAEKSSEPVKTVELFEKLLPYAMVLGVEDKWAKQFQDIYRQPPDWYAGNWSTFNAVYFASSLNGAVGAMSSSFAPPHSSGSGGGFAGGGGGGGGGGGW